MTHPVATKGSVAEPGPLAHEDEGPFAVRRAPGFYLGNHGPRIDFDTKKMSAPECGCTFPRVLVSGARRMYRFRPAAVVFGLDAPTPLSARARHASGDFNVAATGPDGR